MSVEPARLRNHMQCHIGRPPLDQRRILPTELSLRQPVAGTERCDPGNRHRTRSDIGKTVNEVSRRLTQLLPGEFVGTDGGSPDEVRHSDSAFEQLQFIRGIESTRGIDLVIGETRLMQRRPETVAGTRERCIHRRCPQPRVDSDDEHLQPGRIGWQDIVDRIRIIRRERRKVVLGRFAAAQRGWPTVADEVVLTHIFHTTVVP